MCASNQVASSSILGRAVCWRTLRLISGGFPAITRSISNNAPMRSSASFAIADLWETYSSKKPRRTWPSRQLRRHAVALAAEPRRRIVRLRSRTTGRSPHIRRRAANRRTAPARRGSARLESLVRPTSPSKPQESRASVPSACSCPIDELRRCARTRGTTSAWVVARPSISSEAPSIACANRRRVAHH
jgi:hypothetical protein